MPKYFFHLRDGQDDLLDPEGTVLLGIAEAQECALQHARSIIADDALGGVINLDQRIDVEDEKGTLLHSKPLVDAVSIKLPEAVV
jgi:hypothetical protein